MSTTSDATATSGPNQTAPTAPRISLPSFVPARAPDDRRQSHAESSTSGSRWSLTNRRSHSPSGLRASSSVGDNDDGQLELPSTNVLQRRNQNRTGGGFLLEPTTHSSRLAKAVLSRSAKDVKGKRKSHSPEIVLPKRRNKQQVQDKEPSLKGSLLSFEVKQEQNTPLNNDGGSPGSLQGAQGKFATPDGSNGNMSSQQPTISLAGLDTDPAQIVNMALKLSEGRRRQASGRRLISGDMPGKRVVSSTSSRQLRTPTKTLGQFITSSDTVPTSPLPDASKHNGTVEEGNGSMLVDDSVASFNASQFVTDPMEMEIDVSRATAARVEKAKTYMELAYEHRRLLSHLPPIQKPDRDGQSEKMQGDSKSYNPLQYARNRKLRVREKTTIDSEADGWHDVEKVRTWVDAVVNNHTATNHDPLECVRLPPLSLKKDDEADSRSPELRSSPRSPRQQQARPRRPKLDWITHPADLLADAFWLEQGLNKTKIQNRDNEAIYPANTTFRFSGWRNRTPVEVPNRLQQPTPPPEDLTAQQPVRPIAAAPQLPTFHSAHKKRKDVSKGQKRSKLTKASPAQPQNNSVRKRLSLLDSGSDFDTDSDTSSHNSHNENSSRGRERISKRFDLPDGDPFAQPVSSAYPESGLSGSLSPSEVNLARQESKRPSIDQSRLVGYIKRNSVFKTSSKDRGRSNGDARRRRLFRPSKDVRDDDRTSIEDDSTAPSSPAQYGLPSIAINLDVPVSRSQSPTKKSNSSLLQPFWDKHKTQDYDKIDTTDFARPFETSHSRNKSADASRNRDSSNDTSRGTSPFTRATSPFAKLRRESTVQEDRPPNLADYRTSTVSRQSTRPVTLPPQEPPSRIRGIFKGGRIAELVGNEVTRVGDFIWKRDVPPAYRHHSGSEASIRTYEPSDTDESVQNGFVYKTPARETRRSVSSQSSYGGRQPRESPKSNEKPQLHNPNLPSFTSPFQRDRDRQEQNEDFLTTDGRLSADDHISRQAAHYRNRSKSPRLDRLVLPKLDTSGPQSVGLEHRESYGFGDAIDRPQSVSRSLNDVINARSKNTSAKSSIAGLPNQFRKSIDDMIRKQESTGLERLDLSRIEALLMISAVKARNLASSFDHVPSEPSRILLRTIQRTGSYSEQPQNLKVRKRDEHVLAAQNLITQLANHDTRINSQLRTFSNGIVAQLHREIQELEDHVENTITPRVRVAADNAGELSVKLTTTSTQAVKSLHDTISEAFRLRRRGPFRWLRLLSYTLIEWGVVGLLWFIWAVVSVIRLFIGLFRGFGRGLRWLLWID